MNIDSARTIPVSEILDKIGLQPVKKKNNDYWYHSPFRHENTASFHINLAKNVWYDFGEDKGGDTITFVCTYLKSTGNGHTVPDALRWLRNMFQKGIVVPFAEKAEPETEKNLILKSVKPLTHVALIHYLESRSIRKETAQHYLKEVRIYNKETQKEYFAAAIKNEEGGYDYRNVFFKGCVNKKAISFIRGSVVPTEGIHIFEGFMDFLSGLMQQPDKKFHEDVIILNSLSCLREATGYIRGFGYNTAYAWLDNDEAGKKATLALKEFFRSENLMHVAMNPRYAPYKDVNEWHVAHLALQAGR